MASGWNRYGPSPPYQPQGQLPWTTQQPVHWREERVSFFRKLARLAFGSSRSPIPDAANPRPWVSGPWSIPSQVPHPAYGATSANIAAQPALSSIYTTPATVHPYYPAAPALPWNQLVWPGSAGHPQQNPQPVNPAASGPPWNSNPGSYLAPAPHFRPSVPAIVSSFPSAIGSPAAGSLNTVASSSGNGIQSSAVYEYRPLNVCSRQIRLLTLSASLSPESEIQCDLKHTSLDTDPMYIAVSYVWGVPEPARFIRLGGASMKIRPNLFALLQRLRFSSEPLQYALWVDALCINQDDPDERNSQVQLMGTIYSKAKSVLCWLGEESVDSKLAFEAIEIFADFMNKIGDASGLEPARAHLLHCLKSAEYDKYWDAVGNLFAREYWSRVWITQEIILSKCAVLVCGTDMCRWETVWAMLNYIDSRRVLALSNTAMKTFARPILYPRSLAYLVAYGKEGGNICLSKWLSISRQREATDSRDKVFAVLGLTRNGGYRVDYGKTKGKVFREITKHVISLEGNLDVLSCCGSFFNQDLGELDGIEDSITGIWEGRAALYTAYDKTPPHLNTAFQWPEGIQNSKDLPPSWVPDWTLRYRWGDRHSLVANLRRECYFRAAGDSVPDVRYIESQEKMLAFGICVDTIASAHPYIEHRGVEELFQKEWELWKEDWSIPQRYGDDAANRLAFKSAAVLGRDCEGRKQCFTAEESIDDDFFGLPTNGAMGNDRGQTHISQVDWLDAASNTIPGRRFFITRSGFIGRGPLGLRRGDVVVVLLGGKVPFILRPSGKPNRGYIMIGEAYVQGIMEGEIIKELQEGTRNLEELVLI